MSSPRSRPASEGANTQSIPLGSDAAPSADWRASSGALASYSRTPPTTRGPQQDVGRQGCPAPKAPARTLRDTPPGEPAHPRLVGLAGRPARPG
eukprot:5795016-Pyramimonas_sp.AAC.1